MVIIRRKTSVTETAVGLGILLCLAGVVVYVLVTQRNLNPAVRLTSQSWSQRWTEAGLPGTQAQTAGSGGFNAYMPAELVEFGPFELFDEDNLSDKINGKADLYLTSGFKQLRCQRFALRDSQDEWFELFVYEMGSMPQAFAVYSIQRRSEAKPIQLTEFAYATKNALYFVCGQFYVEAIAAQPSESLMGAMLAMAHNFVAVNKPGPMYLPELDLFPTEDMVPYSQTLQITSAFGFEGFTNVFAAKYIINGKPVLAYLTVLNEPEQAAALAQAYYRFLLANGAKEVVGHSSIVSVKMVNLLDSYEVVFNCDKIVGGVHAAHSAQAAEQVAATLLNHIANKTGAARQSN